MNAFYTGSIVAIGALLKVVMSCLKSSPSLEVSDKVVDKGLFLAEGLRRYL